MFKGWRSHYLDFLSGSAYLLLGGFALQISEARAWIACLLLVAGIGLIAWIASYRRMRTIADLPTSRIASAAQGYAELYGRAVSAPDHLIVSPYTAARCVWYRFCIYERGERNHWELQHEGVSHELFVISDGSGQCFIDPDHAEVVGTERRVSYDGQYKRVEHVLYAGAIYALGEFTTVGGASMPLDSKEDVANLLAEWKQDKASLLQRFDLDGNGEIDMQEWNLARKAAMREVERQHRELRAAPGVHLLRAPANGRMFLLSSLSPQKLRRRYFWLCNMHGLVALSALLGLMLLRQHLPGF